MAKDTTQQQSEAQAIIESTLRLSAIETRQLEHEGRVLPYVVGRDSSGSIEIKTLDDELDSLRSRPAQRKGLSALDSALSLTNFANRYKGPNSTLWVRMTDQQVAFSAVIDDHQSGFVGAPEFGDFRGNYLAEYSREWKEWTGKAGQKMGQGEFAEWIEERLPDITGEATHPKVLELFDRQELTPAPPAQLLQVSRGLRVHVSAKVNEARNLSTGETEIVYAEEHAHVDKAGNRMRVPSAFVLKVPVFDHDDPVEVAAFLRYSLEGGAVKWMYRLYRPHLAREERGMALAQRISTDTGLPLFLGIR